LCIRAWVLLYSDKVLAGKWDDVRSLLPQLKLDDAVAETTATALVLCQQMMEALEAGQVAEALALLRSELTPRATSTSTTTAAAAAGGEKGGGQARKTTRYVLDQLYSAWPWRRRSCSVLWHPVVASSGRPGEQNGLLWFRRKWLLCAGWTARLGVSPVQGFDMLLANSLYCPWHGVRLMDLMTVTRMTKVWFGMDRRDMGTDGPTYGGGGGGDSGLVGWRHPHRLAALFVCSDAAELREHTQWAGSGVHGRMALLRELQVRRLSCNSGQTKRLEGSRVGPSSCVVVRCSHYTLQPQ
jgi:hypothetical protein